MISRSVAIHPYSSSLCVVPAMHFCHVFAAEVNRICSDPATKPQAIAVELGPRTAAAARLWLQELNIDPRSESTLPVMLALVKRNRMIRASLKEKAFRIQRKTGKDLKELAPETLYRDFGFADHSVLFLSPIDSIIEAIRCSLELGIPLYGVDLEETANGNYESAVIQDPLSCGKSRLDYMAANLSLACATRDCEIDPRREITMAARLKSLAQQHSSLLFTCGMAHWLKIEEMLADDSLQPARVDADYGEAMTDFKRIVVHPSIAVRHTDLFPSLVLAYEKWRISAAQPSVARTGAVDAARIFRGHLQKAYRDYFSRRISTALSADRTRDLESVPVFEAYLQGMGQLNHRAVPDLFMTITAARETMSSGFTQVLADTFMKFPWTTPGNHSGCSVLMPPADPASGPDCLTLTGDGFPAQQRVYMRPILNSRPSSKDQQISYSYKWGQKKDSFTPSLRYTWRPWEYLISAMSLRAIQARKKKDAVRKTVLFEGYLLEGIDMKTTLRAFSRGNDSLYVKDRIFEESGKPANPVDGFPIVWILNPGEHRGAEWKFLHEPAERMEGYIRDVKTFHTIVKNRGDCMVASIGYGCSESIKRRLSTEQSVSVDHYYGIVIFQPICWTNRQFARWAEMTRYGRNPFYHGLGWSILSKGNLKNWYERVHGIRFDEYDWTTTLTLIALPFCKDWLTVVTPEECRIEPVAFEKARKYGVKLVAAPLKMFSQEQISRLARCQMVPATHVEPETEYSKSIEKAIGEPQTRNRELVPPEWLNFGGDG